MALNNHSEKKEDKTTLPDNKLSTSTDAAKNRDRVDLEGNYGRRGNFWSRSPIGGRIAPVLPHLRGYDFGTEGDTDGSSDILGKQIEMEAENAIQYRTCSWQKVWFPTSLQTVCLFLTKPYL
jgi:hypothetical protein